MMKYHFETTKSHPKITQHSDCFVVIDLLLRKDGCNISPPCFQNNTIFVVDGDQLERKIALVENRNKNRSMDVIFATTSSSNNTKMMQLVEFKFNCENPNNLVGDELREKVDGSKIALGTEIAINKNFYFVFKKGLKEQARNRFQRMNPKLENEFIPIYIDELKNIFF